MSVKGQRRSMKVVLFSLHVVHMASIASCALPGQGPSWVQMVNTQQHPDRPQDFGQERGGQEAGGSGRSTFPGGWADPDIAAHAGRLLRVELSSVLTQGAEQHVPRFEDLPPWLVYDEETGQLLGVPAPRDVGRASLTLSLTCQPSGGASCEPTTYVITISVWPPASDPVERAAQSRRSTSSGIDSQVRSNSIASFSDPAVQNLQIQPAALRSEDGPPERHGENLKLTVLSDQSQESPKCSAHYVASLVLCADPDRLGSSRRVQVVQKAAQFLSEPTDSLGLLPSSGDRLLFLNKGYSAQFGGASDGGNCGTGGDEASNAELFWPLSCSAARHVREFAKILQHNVDVGRIAREMGVEVVGWYVASRDSAVSSAKHGHRRRRRRQAATRTPVPTPTLYQPTATLSSFSSSVMPTIEFTQFSSSPAASAVLSLAPTPSSVVAQHTQSAASLEFTTTSSLGVSSLSSAPSTVVAVDHGVSVTVSTVGAQQTRVAFDTSSVSVLQPSVSEFSHQLFFASPSLQYTPSLSVGEGSRKSLSASYDLESSISSSSIVSSSVPQRSAWQTEQYSHPLLSGSVQSSLGLDKAVSQSEFSRPASPYTITPSEAFLQSASSGIQNIPPFMPAQVDGPEATTAMKFPFSSLAVMKDSSIVAGIAPSRETDREIHSLESSAVYLVSSQSAIDFSLSPSRFEIHETVSFGANSSESSVQHSSEPLVDQLSSPAHVFILESLSSHSPSLQRTDAVGHTTSYVASSGLSSSPLSVGESILEPTPTRSTMLSDLSLDSVTPSVVEVSQDTGIIVSVPSLSLSLHPTATSGTQVSPDLSHTARTLSAQPSVEPSSITQPSRTLGTPVFAPDTAIATLFTDYVEDSSTGFEVPFSTRTAIASEGSIGLGVLTSHAPSVTSDLFDAMTVSHVVSSADGDGAASSSVPVVLATVGADTVSPQITEATPSSAGVDIQSSVVPSVALVTSSTTSSEAVISSSDVIIAATTTSTIPSSSSSLSSSSSTTTLSSVTPAGSTRVSTDEATTTASTTITTTTTATSTSPSSTASSSTTMAAITTTATTTTTAAPTTTRTTTTTTTTLPPKTTARTTPWWFTTQSSSTSVTADYINHSPFVFNSLRYMTAALGQYFERRIPEDMFYDQEDGYTRSLALTLTLPYDQPLPPNFWVQFDSSTQTLMGLPLVADLDMGYHSVVVVAMDSQGLGARNPISLYVNSSAFVHFTHRFIMKFDVDFGQFMRRRDNVMVLLSRIATYFGDDSAQYVTVVDVSIGSFVLSWTNSSLSGAACQNKTVQGLLSRMVRRDGSVRSSFNRHIGRKLNLKSVTHQPDGSCLYRVPVTAATTTTTTDTDAGVSGYKPESDPNLLTDIILPVLIALLLILLIVIIALFVYRCRQQRGVMETLDKDLYTVERTPVILPSEMPNAETYNSRPKKPAALPGFDEDRYTGSFPRNRPRTYEHYKQSGSLSRNRPNSYTFDDDRSNNARPVTVIFNNFDSLPRQSRPPSYWNARSEETPPNITVPPPYNDVSTTSV